MCTKFWWRFGNAWFNISEHTFVIVVLLVFSRCEILTSYILYSTDIDECSTSPCFNGYCIDDINGYICTCSPGYEGVDCEIGMA
jgi:hypothetical protein